MSKAIQWVLSNTAHNFSYDGVQNLKAIDGSFLMLSNHRDIILDPAITQYVLYQNGLPLSQICVGDNLLSKYIRDTITGNKSSIWLAQRQGRTKNGEDTTEQGLLKMLDMSGTKSFQESFSELNIVPLSISYEYEPCDILKAREVLITRHRKYIKEENEDLKSILVGIRQPKGNIHLNIGTAISDEEIDKAKEAMLAVSEIAEVVGEEFTEASIDAIGADAGKAEEKAEAAPEEAATEQPAKSTKKKKTAAAG